MPSALVLVQFPRRIRVSSKAVEEELDASEPPTPVNLRQPSPGAASISSKINNDPEQQPSTPGTCSRSRLIHQATVQFGADKLQKTSHLRSSTSQANMAADETNASTPVVAPSAGGAGSNSLPSGLCGKHGEAMEREEEVTIEVEAMVRAMLQEFLDAGYLQGYPTWTSCLDGKYMNAFFTCHADLATLVVLKLEYIGIGSDVGAVNATPVKVGRSAILARRLAEERKKKQRMMEERRQLLESRHQRSPGCVEHDSAENLQNKTSQKPMVSKMAGAMSGATMSARKHWGRFLIPEGDSKFLSATSIFRVEELAEQISGMALFTFDYMMFVIIASVIAAVGLASDNAVVVVAAMLLSPIMGPIMAFTFGTATRDWEMVVSGLVVETLSLFLCIVVGFLYGVGTLDELEEGEWPTEQMFSRADTSSTGRVLTYGIIVAVPSGMGIALSLLNQNVSGLVGVAISASLTPPAVGAGMYWAYALLGNSICDFYVDSQEMAREGAISFALTLVNIVCVTLSALFMFYLKRVVPSTQNESFWKRDFLNHARSHNIPDDERHDDVADVYKLLQQTGTQGSLQYNVVGSPVSESTRGPEEKKC